MSQSVLDIFLSPCQTTDWLGLTLPRALAQDQMWIQDGSMTLHMSVKEGQGPLHVSVGPTSYGHVESRDLAVIREPTYHVPPM